MRIEKIYSIIAERIERLEIAEQRKQEKTAMSAILMSDISKEDV